VGIGGYGTHYLDHFLAAKGGEPSASLTAVVDPHADRSPRLEEIRAKGISVYPSIEEYYDRSGSTPELVVLSTPIPLHAKQTCYVLGKGSHVLCEKPLCSVVQEVPSMIEARDRAGKIVAIGYQMSFSPTIQKLKAEIQRGTFGKPVRMKTVAWWSRSEEYYKRNNWAGAKKLKDGTWILDSPVQNALAHQLHNMFYLLGSSASRSAMPKDVTAELYRVNPIENYDTAALRTTTEEGTEILFLVSHAVRIHEGPDWHFEFEKGIVTWKGQSGDVVAAFKDGSTMNFGNPNKSDKVAVTVRNIREGTETPCGIEASMAQTICTNGASESMLEIVDLPKDLVKTGEKNGFPLLYADEIQQALEQCWTKNALPSELGIKWARAGKKIDLRGYREFKG
jgi:predicted dehydrogenase